MSPEEYIAQQPEERREIMLALHQLVMATDTSVDPIVEPMMGKEMILYKEANTMKYGLASVKAHISIHSLPMYSSPELYEKYLELLPKAKFQKGCINFTKPEAVPLSIIGDFFANCAKISMADLMAKWKKK